MISSQLAELMAAIWADDLIDAGRPLLSHLLDGLGKSHYSRCCITLAQAHKIIAAIVGGDWQFGSRQARCVPYHSKCSVCDTTL